MSQENVEVVRRVMAATRDAMARDDLPAAFPPGTFDVDFEWVTPVPFEGKTVWTGVEESIEFLRVWTEQFENYSLQVLRVSDAGEGRVVALMRSSATGRESGAPVVWETGAVYELRNGRIFRASNYLSHADALEAAGLSE